MGNTVTETNEQVHAALEAAAGAAVEVVYVRKGEQRQTTLLPVWDTQNAQWRAGMWVRDSSAGVGTLTFVDVQAGVFAGLGHPISCLLYTSLALQHPEIGEEFRAYLKEFCKTL